jgi:cysteine desulfurase family protein (TIGR01976 family)
MILDPIQLRAQFPALATGAVYFDNPGGTQVPQRVIDRMVDYLKRSNANLGGAFPTSQASDALIEETRIAVADFLNAASPEEIVFGPNMTSLSFNLSRSIARELNSGDEILVTRLDHDANITPWTTIAEERDCQVHWVDFDVEDCTLRLEHFDTLISERTRLVAAGYASNAVGTINPVAYIIERAHEAGALCFIDAVQYAPHGPIDVQALDCDFLAVSAYKFFGPHIAALYGKKRHLERLPAYRVRPAPSDPPGKFETGTGNHEGIAGLLGALEYLEAVGEKYGEAYAPVYEDRSSNRKLSLKAALAAIQRYEYKLTESLIDRLESIPGLTIWGITDPAQIEQRVPTVSFTLEGFSPRRVARALGEAGIYVWDGNYYALAVTERLGLEEHGGMVRVGPVHYNTLAEIDRLAETLLAMLAGK